MIKLQRFSEYQHTFTFNNSTEQFEIFQQRFFQSDLGKIYHSIPWDELIKNLELKERVKGPNSIFSPKGKIALMFLKNYSGCSDRKLMEQLNGNLDWQFFCDIYLGTERLTNYKIISEIRCELAVKLDISQVQKTLFNHWSAFINNKNSITMDATCYESFIRYPTNVKVLWESVEWMYGKMKKLSKKRGVNLPRTKYLKWEKRYISYAKMRRKSKKKRRTLTRSLLLLLQKLIYLMDALEKGIEKTLSPNHHKRRSTIKKVYIQQYEYFHEGKKPKNRIVSIDKPYIRPIVRGKEVKPVEFGAKVNKVQVDGISFIEHLSFDAFHEGIRFVDAIFNVQSLTKTKTKLAGADAIYATNKNRKFASKNGVQTDFKRKGRAGKHEKQRLQLSKAIQKERATRLEGSFGKDKEHYLLRKIKARTETTEILWIFFGIQVGNALEIGRRMCKVELEQAA